MKLLIGGSPCTHWSISRLQAHGFQWEDEPFEVLYDRYPNCKAALLWWCNAFGTGSRVNIEKCRLLKEFMVANPPKIKISDGCCKGAKKDVAHDYIKEIKATINVVGIRKAEGGARATAYNSCFSEPSSKSEAAQFRPLFYFTDQDKELYCQRRGVVHTRGHPWFLLCYVFISVPEKEVEISASLFCRRRLMGHV